MKRTFSIILFALAAVIGCTKAEQSGSPSDENAAFAAGQSKNALTGNRDSVRMMVTLPGQLPRTETKTANVNDGAGSYRFEWSDNDTINVSGNKFALSQKSSGLQAVFAGAAPTGTSFDIVYPATLTEAEFNSIDFNSFTQYYNNGFGHVPCMFIISDVDTYEYVTVSSEWAQRHGGSLKMTGCLKLVIQIPGSEFGGNGSKVELVADSDIFHSTNDASSSTSVLSLSLESASLVQNRLTAYLPLSCHRIDFTEDTKLTVKMYLDDGPLFVKKFKPGRQSIEPGVVNEMFITGDGWDPKSGTGAHAGTIDNPFQITDLSDLIEVESKLKKYGSDRAVYFKQTADIDCSLNQTFTPINDLPTTTNAINYDGGDHTISNLKCKGKSYASLFGILNGRVCNLTIENATIEGNGSTNCGVVAACLGDVSDEQRFGGVLENVTVISSTVSGQTPAGCYMGGLVGEARNSVIKDCTFGDAVSSVTNTSSDTDSGTGGLIGCYMACNEISNCTVHGSITSSARNTGGVIGLAYGPAISISECSCDAGVNGEADAVGGFIGNARGGCELDNCTVNSNVESSASPGHCGGFVGIANDSYKAIGAIFRSCSFTGDVTASAGPYAGGFVGCSYKSVICEECSCGASSNTVQATSCSGGLAGAVLDYSAADPGNPKYIGSSVSVLKVTDTECDITVKAISTGGDQNGRAGGLAGAVNGKVIAQRSCYNGNVSGYRYTGGLVGYAGTGPVSVEDCYTTGSVSATDGYSAGLVAELPKNSTVSRCYSTATVKGHYAAGGLIGRAFGGQGQSASVENNVNTTITDCIAWNDRVYNDTKIPFSEIDNYYSCGGIIGFTSTVNTLSRCYRNPVMTLDCYEDSKYNELFNQDDAGPEKPLDRGDERQGNLYYPYHGKSADDGATASSVAGRLGWEETIWDISGPLPRLLE